jgi:2'-5' RNA ligase
MIQHGASFGKGRVADGGLCASRKGGTEPVQNNMIRAFVAIELPPTVTQELENIQRRLGKGAGTAARWVAPSGIHLTLKFLGDVAEARTAQIASALESACRAAKPLELGLQGAGAFPEPERPRVLWVGLRGDVAGLRLLQRQVDDALAPLGFAPEARGFTPHLTLARMRDGADPVAIRTLVQKLSTVSVAPAAFRAEEAALIRSELRPAGAVYTRLSAARLGL